MIKNARLRILLIPLMALLLFPLSNQERPRGFPEREDGTWSSLNLHSLFFLENWRLHGAASSKFSLHIPGPEKGYLATKLYSSYPAGFLLPLHVLELANRSKDPSQTLERARALAALGHFLLACIAGLTSLFLSASLLASFASIYLTLFLPTLLLFQHNLWWADTTGLLAAAAALLFHLHSKNKSSGIALAMGVFCDWFTLFLAPLFALQKKKRLGWLLVPSGLALLLFLAQQAALGGLQPAFDKLLLRSGLEPSSDGVSWARHFSFAFLHLSRLLGSGGWLIPLLLFPALFFQESKRRIKLISPFLIAIVLHWLVFSQHYADHPYNLVRWTYALALFPALFPARLGQAAAIFCLGWAFSIGPTFKNELALESQIPHEELAACKLVSRHHSLNSFFVSPDFSTGTDGRSTLWHLPFCRSVVRKVRLPEDLKNEEQKLFIRLGLKDPGIRHRFVLARDPLSPKWKAKEVDAEPPWKLFEL